MDKIIAISWADFGEYGCANCGCEYCYSGPIVGGPSISVTCGECNTGFIIVANGLTKSKLGIPSDDGSTYFPDVQSHPRKGIPKHEYIKPDIKPEVGEYWAPRGVGTGMFGADLSGFVKSKQAGERIVGMVRNLIGREPRTYLDYRQYEPNWIQVKFQSVDGFDLNKLDKICSGDGIITEEKLKQCLI